MTLAKSKQTGRAATARSRKASSPTGVETFAHSPVIDRQVRLEEAFAAELAVPALETVDAARPRSTQWDAEWLVNGLRAHRTTVIKSSVAVAAAIVLVWSPAQRLLSTTSTQAVVNARVVSIRSPIDGLVSERAANMEVGTSFKQGAALLTIHNRRVDQSHLDALQRAEADVEDALAVLDAKHEVLQQRIKLERHQIESFRNNRITQLEQRVSAFDADITAALAASQTASADVTRAEALHRKGVMTTAEFDRRASAGTSAREKVERLRRERQVAQVELGALRTGTFVGDSYNDVPQSAQRLQDDELMLAEVEARRKVTQVRLEELKGRVAEEVKRQELLSKSLIRVPQSGRVWEVLVTPGETVSRGQVLLKMLDCSQFLVTASVSEDVYQRLWIGQPAVFRPRSGGRELEGRVSGLSGLASLGEHDAIPESALSKEPFKVALKFPGLDTQGQCSVGRSGQVVFDTSKQAATPRAVAAGT